MKGCAIGCLVMLLLLAIPVGLGIYYYPQIKEWVQTKFLDEIDRAKIVELWQPLPDDVDADRLFPLKLLDYRRESHDKLAEIEEFKIVVPGRHASYRRGESRIDVYHYKVDELKKDSLFDHVAEVQKSDGGEISRMPYRLYYSSADHGQNHLWSIKGHLFLFRTEDDDDCESFIKEYLRETSNRPQKKNE